MRGVGGDGIRGEKHDWQLESRRKELTTSDRICTANSRIRLFPRVQVDFPPKSPRVQWYVVCSRVAYTREDRRLTEIGLFEYEEYISLKTINDPNEG